MGEPLVAQLFDIASRMRERVVYVKQNKAICREICAEVLSLSGILEEVEQKYHGLSQATKDTLTRYMPLMRKGYDEAIEYIESQIKVGSIKKFNTSKCSKYLLDTLVRSLHRSKQALLTALDDKVDPSVCATPIPSTVGIEKHIESILLAFNTKNYMQALQIGKEVLRKLPQDDFKTKAGIHYDMACIHSQLCNPQSAVFHLQSARAHGFSDFKQLDEDRDLNNVRFQIEFVNFRQTMEYEVLQTERWREMSEQVVDRLTALFDLYDDGGLETLSFSQFQALCSDLFSISSPAQVMVFWREICEDTIEAMHLVEFLNFLLDHTDLLHRLVPQELTKPQYCTYPPAYFSPQNSPPSTNEIQSACYSHNPLFPANVEYSAHESGYPQQGQACRWMEEATQWQVHSTTANICQQNFVPQATYVTSHFSYYTMTNPLASFKC